MSLRFQARPGRGARSVQETGGRTVQIGLGPRVWAGRTCPGRHTPCIAAGTAWRASCVMAEGGSGGVYFERGIEAQSGWRRWVNERWVGVRGSPKRAKSDTAACHPPPAPPGLCGQARSSMGPFQTPLHGGIVEIRTNSRAGIPICTIKSSASQGSEPSPQLRSGLLSAFRRDLNQSQRMHHIIRQQTTERHTHFGTIDGWVKTLMLSSTTKGRAVAGSAATTGVAGARMIPVGIGARRSAEQAAR